MPNMESIYYFYKTILTNDGQESSDYEDQPGPCSILQIPDGKPTDRHGSAVTIVLDGSEGVGKSVLVNRLQTGEYKWVPPTVGPITITHDVTVNEVKYKTVIHDTNGHENAFYSTNMKLYNLADVIIEIFAIDRPETLSQVINDRIPLLRAKFPKTPILLVGSRADRRPKSSLFPLELGPILGQAIGAVKYVEYSSVRDFNVHEVFEEAVSASLAEKYLAIVDRGLFGMLIDKAPYIDSDWADVLKEMNPSTLFPVSNPHFQQDLQLVEHHLIDVPSRIEIRSEKDVYRVLEHERISLSHGLAGTDYIVRESQPPSCSLWNVIPDGSENQIMNCRLFSVTESCENMICEQSPLNFRLFKETCESILNFFTTTINPLLIRSLMIVNCSGVLNFSFLNKLTGLEYLVIVNTKVNIESLTFPTQLHDSMKHLVMHNCGITQATDVPPMIGKLKNLQLLNLKNNNFKKLPTSMSFLQQLQTLLIDHEKVDSPPAEVLNKSAQVVVKYLETIQEGLVENNEAKLVVVGQKGVGKSTLIKAMESSKMWFSKNNLEPSAKTVGVNISMLPLNNFKCKVFDLAGDVEDLDGNSLFLSSNCLHLCVFNLSKLIANNEFPDHHLCRLELWLQTIASRDPQSYVILVGTYADHPIVCREIILKNRELLKEVFKKYLPTHTERQMHSCEECIICNPEKSPDNLGCLEHLNKSEPPGEDSQSVTSCSKIPHVLGYFEVSGITKYPNSFLSRNNIEDLTSATTSSITTILKLTETETIPIKWLSFRNTIEQKLTSDENLKHQPVMQLSLVREIAFESDIARTENVLTMLRFFHSQGTFLWYEDLPEMKDFVIMDPQWLSDKLRTIISHSVTSNRTGFAPLKELSKLWGPISEENCLRLLCLFRSVGFCFSISATEEFFPCNLPVGWPDREMWSPLPNPKESQTSLVFEFNYVPPSLFPNLIVEVNKKRKTFADVKPLYYRFHIVYITKGEAENGDCLPTQSSTVWHTIHYELIPYTNSLTVSIRGSHPRSIIPDIRCTLETVKCRRYPGIFYNERLLCPECVLKKVQPPASFKLDCSHDGVCSRGHKVGSNEVILEGKFDSSTIVPSAIGQAGRVVGETLQDCNCPRLFVVLPINRDRQSYFSNLSAIHLLCECPNQWHFLDYEGFSVKEPKEFFKKYGPRVCKVLRMISKISILCEVAATVFTPAIIGVPFGYLIEFASEELESLLESYLDKYPYLKSTLGPFEDDMNDLKSSSGLQRSELSRFLNIEAKGHSFGPLVATYVDKYNQWLWLCEEHNKMFQIVER